jgi:hypothetical protein
MSLHTLKIVVHVCVAPADSSATDVRLTTYGIHAPASYAHPETSAPQAPTSTASLHPPSALLHLSHTQHGVQQRVACSPLSFRIAQAILHTVVPAASRSGKSCPKLGRGSKKPGPYRAVGLSNPSDLGTLMRWSLPWTARSRYWRTWRSVEEGLGHRSVCHRCLTAHAAGR